MQMQFRQYRKHILAVGLFVVLTLIYFAPAFLEGKVIRQGDMEKNKGMTEEVRNYAASEEGKDKGVIAWTGSMFSGMPTYSLYVPGTSHNYLKYLEMPLKVWDSQGGSILLTALICFYILMCVMKVNFWLALAGSIAFAFSSYNLIIIEAGHITKAYTIAYMPLTIAGMCLLFRQKWWLGGGLFVLGVALSLINSHIQITYYLAFFCLFIYAGYLVKVLKEKKYKELWKTTAILVVGVGIAVLPSVGNLYANMEMSRESLRGPSELTQVTTGNTDKVSTGLDINYAFAWSYDKTETFTLLIPNFYGGGSIGDLGPDSKLYQESLRYGSQVGKSVQSFTYWGDQPGTSGPVYFGALICFLFVLGMFVIRNKMKWWILGAVVFFLILSWGRHWIWINEFLFHYLPMYNKFRTPSMALVIPGMVFPLIAIWGLKDILSGKVDRIALKRGLTYALGISGGICLIFWILPGLFLDFASARDAGIIANYKFPDWYYRALLEDRESLLRMDAFRSLVFILLGAALIQWYRIGKDKLKIARYAAIGITVLVFVDLWSVDKRYLNDDKFESPRAVNPYAMTRADHEILKDKDISYRVLTLNDPFNETNTSFYHKSIGGYSAVKLRRYQELIDHRIGVEMSMLIKVLNSFLSQGGDLAGLEAVFRQTPTLNMLNTRYVIYNPGVPPLVNPYADGNVWFVQDYKVVENADAEIGALDEINPLVTAVIDKRFAAAVEGLTILPDSTATIRLESYEPIELVYKSHTQSEQLAVFSEIYYAHGWQAYIDGKPAEHFRTDWILRGMKIPAGEHTIVFKFEPKGYITASRVATWGSIMILILLLGVLGMAFRDASKPIDD